MSLFPMFLKLAGRRCLVVGAGAIGEAKIESLLQAGAATLVVAPRASETVMRWASAKKLRWQARPFCSADVEGMSLVIAATSHQPVNDRVFRAAKRRGILCNVVDDPGRCDFYYPAVVRRGQLQIAISTGGRSPALAQRLRRELERHFGPEYESWVEELGQARRALLCRPMDAARRRLDLHRLAGREAFRRFARKRPPARSRRS